MVSCLPNATTPTHRHLRCNSAELALSGSAAGSLEGRSISVPTRGDLQAQLRTIGKGEWHGGGAGPHGFVFLSFQMWDGEPDFISNDWEAWKP